MANKTPGNTGDYPVCLDLTNLPPTHNHLIGAVQAISLDNIRGVIALTRRLLTEAEGQELWLSEDQAVGLGCILDNAVGALRFEQYYRQRLDDKPDRMQVEK